MRHWSAGLLLLIPIIAPGTDPITVYLAGDSTMAEKLAERRPETGWGERLQQFFDPAQVRVENHARNGRSTRSFLEEGRWQAIVEVLDAGDHVLIQFGHNDAAQNRPDRYTPPDQFRSNLVRFIVDVREKNAIPVLMTPIVRRRFDARGEFYDAHGEYPDIVRAVAAEHGAVLVDLHRSSERVVREYGAEASRALFLHFRPGEQVNYPEGLEDDTHFSPLGAEIMARLAVEGLQASGLGLAGHLRTFDRVQKERVHQETP